MLTTQSSSPAQAISWMWMSPVKCERRGRKQASCLPGGSSFCGDGGMFVVLQHLRARADGQPAAAEARPIGLWKSRKCVLTPSPSRRTRDQLAGLVGGDQQRDAELVEDLGEVGAVDAAQRRGGRRVGSTGAAASRASPGGWAMQFACPGGQLRGPRDHRLDLAPAPRPLGSSSLEAGAGEMVSGAATPANSQMRSISGAGSSPRTARVDDAPARTGGRRSRSVSRIRVAIAHCSAAISGSELPARLRHSGVSEQRPRRALPAGQLGVG